MPRCDHTWSIHSNYSLQKEFISAFHHPFQGVHSSLKTFAAKEIESSQGDFLDSNWPFVEKYPTWTHQLAHVPIEKSYKKKTWYWQLFPDKKKWPQPKQKVSCVSAVVISAASWSFSSPLAVAVCTCPVKWQPTSGVLWFPMLLQIMKNSQHLSRRPFSLTIRNLLKKLMDYVTSISQPSHEGRHLSLPPGNRLPHHHQELSTRIAGHDLSWGNLEGSPS